MATALTLGSAKTFVGESSWVGGRITVSITSQSISDNSSTVQVKVEGCRLDGGHSYTQSSGSDFYVKFDGTSVQSTTNSFDFNGKTYVTIMNFSKTVPHNTDGSKTLNITVGGGLGGDNTFQFGTQEFTVTLTKINRNFTVVYNANGGADEPSSQTKIYDEQLTLTTSEPKKTGYTFVKWNTASDGSGTDYNSGGAYTDNNDVTLYAIWRENVLTVNYWSNYADYGAIGDIYAGYVLEDVNANSNVKAFTMEYKHDTTYDGLFQNSNSLLLSKAGHTQSSGKEWGTSLYVNEVETVDQNLSFTGYELAALLGKDISDGDSSVDVYAQWEEHKLIVNYWSNFATAYGGTYEALNTVNNNNVLVYKETYYYDDEYENGLLNYKDIDSNIYMYRIGYKTTGDWGTETNGGLLVSQDNTTLNTGQKIANAFNLDLENGNAEIDVYAQWDINKLIVNYCSNYATSYNGTYNVDTIVDNNNVYLCTKIYDYYENYPSGMLDYTDEGNDLYMCKIGYLATGYWGTETDGGNLVHQNDSFDTGKTLAVAFGRSIENEDVTINVYAQWEPTNIVQYKTDDVYVLCNTYGKVDGLWKPMMLYGKENSTWKKIMKIEANGRVLFHPEKSRYVSFGDSIAAGHAINDDWYTIYGEDSQYGKNGNTETVIVPNTYTDLIRNELVGIYGENRVLAKSFARSGDRVSDLMEKLSHETIRNTLEKANIVTICIGANDVLEPALSHLEDYINTGELDSLATIIEGNLEMLNNDTNATSYTALFNKLTEINPKAKYIFTTIYNPYKYLWIEEGKNGFFSPILNTIPQMNILGFEVDELIKDGLLNTDIVRKLYSRINGLGEWTEKYVEGNSSFMGLNQVLRNKVNAYKSVNPNFYVAETKTLYDPFPDRPISATRHYNDLVNVEYTRGYDTAKMDWGKLWVGSDVETFWWDLATKYVSLSGFDIEGFANDLIQQVIVKVVVPDVDPHPKTYGQYVLKRSFADVLNWTSLDKYTITFDANGGSGSMSAQDVVGVDGLTAYTNIKSSSFIPATGYYFIGWNTKADGSGVSYTNKQLIGINSNITLYAQWSNIYTVTYKHTNHTNLYGNDETGHKECYALYINDVEQDDFGTFAEGSERTIPVVYGSTIKVVCDDYRENNYSTKTGTCDVYWNGTSVANGWGGTEYTFTLTSNVTIDFQWKISGSHVTFDARSWEDCYITTG